MRESNPRLHLGKVPFYRYTNLALKCSQPTSIKFSMTPLPGLAPLNPHVLGVYLIKGCYAVQSASASRKVSWSTDCESNTGVRITSATS